MLPEGEEHVWEGKEWGRNQNYIWGDKRHVWNDVRATRTSALGECIRNVAHDQRNWGQDGSRENGCNRTDAQKQLVVKVYVGEEFEHA